MVKVRDSLKDRYVNARTLPGTRSFHQLTALSATTIDTKRVSKDKTCPRIQFSGSTFASSKAF